MAADDARRAGPPVSGLECRDCRRGLSEHRAVRDRYEREVRICPTATFEVNRHG